MTSAARPLRPARGQVTSYGEHRTCAELDCRTVLSRYNKTDRCWKHEDERWRRSGR